MLVQMKEKIQRAWLSLGSLIAIIWTGPAIRGINKKRKKHWNIINERQRNQDITTNYGSESIPPQCGIAWLAQKTSQRLDIQ